MFAAIFTIQNKQESDFYELTIMHDYELFGYHSDDQRH